MGAYWLLHSLRRAAPKRSRWRGASIETIRRTFVKIAVRVEELKGKIKARLPGQLPSGRHARGDHGCDHDAGPMFDAARAAPALIFNRKRVPIAPEAAAVNPADETRPRFRSFILANKKAKCLKFHWLRLQDLNLRPSDYKSERSNIA
jgi:hypothetical protein